MRPRRRRPLRESDLAGNGQSSIRGFHSNRRSPHPSRPFRHLGGIDIAIPHVQFSISIPWRCTSSSRQPLDRQMSHFRSHSLIVGDCAREPRVKTKCEWSPYSCGETMTSSSQEICAFAKKYCLKAVLASCCLMNCPCSPGVAFWLGWWSLVLQTCSLG